MPTPHLLVVPADPLALPRVPPAAPAVHLWRDRLLAALFLIVLAAPGLALFATAGRTATEFENRTAAPWPRLRSIGSASAFTAGFERAFADRFGGRDGLIQLHHTVEVLVFRRSPVLEVLLGREGWLYYRGDGGHSLDRDFRRFPPPSMTETGTIVEGITRRVRYLAGLDIDYLLVVAPDKHTIYPEYVPPALQPLAEQSLFDAVLARLPADVRSHVLDLRPALLAAKQQRQVYFRTDTHWNANGAWVGYQEILAALRKDPAGQSRPRWPSERIAGTTSGDLARMIGAPSGFAEPDLSLVIGPDDRRCARTESGGPPVWGAPRQSLYCPSAPLGTVAIFHDSMGLPLLPWLPNEFRESHWVEGRTWDPSQLAAASPSLVIDEIVERSLSLLADTSFLDGAAPRRPAGAPLRK